MILRSSSSRYARYWMHSFTTSVIVDTTFEFKTNAIWQVTSSWLCFDRVMVAQLKTHRLKLTTKSVVTAQFYWRNHDVISDICANIFRVNQSTWIKCHMCYNSPSFCGRSISPQFCHVCHFVHHVCPEFETSHFRGSDDATANWVFPKETFYLHTFPCADAEVVFCAWNLNA